MIMHLTPTATRATTAPRATPTWARHQPWQVEEKFDFLRPKGAKNRIFRVIGEMREKI